MSSKKPGQRELGSQKNRSVKSKVNNHEYELAEKLGGVRQPASGALEHRKGDVKLETFLLDSKETDANSIIVSGKDLIKITNEADGEGKEPGLVLTLYKLPSTVSKEWVMVPLEVFVDMLKQKGLK